MTGDDAMTGTGRSTRPIIGALVLVIAIFLALVMPMVLSPGLAGKPSAIPFPDPPPIGACVLLQSSLQPTVVTEVSCDQEHDGEVAKSWAAGESPVPTFVLNRNYSMVATDQDGALLTSDALCSGWGSQYVGTIGKFGPALWAPVDPSYFTVEMVAPPGFGTENHHWTACVVIPGEQQSYLGSVRDSGGTTGNPRPDVFGWCFPDEQPLGSSSIYTNCIQPHRIEQLATFIPTQQMFTGNSIYVDTTRAEIELKCRELATQMIGAPDPTFGGRLEIVASPVWEVLADAGRTAPDTKTGGLRIPDCLVQYTGPGALTGTVVGVGDGTLPVS